MIADPSAPSKRLVTPIGRRETGRVPDELCGHHFPPRVLRLLKLYALQDFARNAIEFHLIRPGSGRDLPHYGSEVVMSPIPDDGGRTKPLFMSPRSEAQELVDTLWNLGVRPSETAWGSALIGSLQSHVKDLQAQVFQLQSIINGRAGRPVQEQYERPREPFPNVVYGPIDPLG